MTDIFSSHIKSGDPLRAETYQNILKFLQGSHVAGGTVSAQGINIPSEFTRNPRTVRFVAEEDIATFSIIELTGQKPAVDNQVPTFKAKPANGDSGTLFYTEFSSADAGGAGLAYVIGGEPILIRSAATADGTPSNGEIVTASGGAFRYLGESDVPTLKWFLPVLGGGTVITAPSDELTVSVFSPARQWTHKLPIDGDENKRLWCDSNDPLHSFGTWFMNACGLTNEGKIPLPVMESVIIDGVPTVQQKTNGNNPLYYQNVKHTVKEKFAQSDEAATEWQLIFDNDENVPPLTVNNWQTTGFVSSYLWLCHLASLDGQATSIKKVDYSDQWATTTDPTKALKIGHQVIAPHNVLGYSLGTTCTYRPAEKKTVRYEENTTVLVDSALTISTPILIPVPKKELANQPIVAKVDIDIYEITEGEQIDGLCGQNTAVELRKLETLEETFNSRECLYAALPEYQNDKPLVLDDISIENFCTEKPLFGLWKDGIFPQLLLCENVPYGYCIPLKRIECLMRVSANDCAPMYSYYKYSVALGQIAQQQIYQPQNVDWLPSLGACCDNEETAP